jgi:hypothetical protein
VGVDTDFGPQQLSARLRGVGRKRLFDLYEAVLDKPLHQIPVHPTTLADVASGGKPISAGAVSARGARDTCTRVAGVSTWIFPDRRRSIGGCL